MDIPVYGLSGLGEVENFVEYANDIGAPLWRKKKKKASEPGKSFKKVVKALKNAAVKKAYIKKHKEALKGIDGIFNTTAAKIANGTSTKKDAADFKKAKVLLTLESTDYDAFRLASIYMPYVSDIDEGDGGYIFPTEELANVAAAGEEEFVEYLKSPYPTELGKLKIFKKIKKAVKKAAKAVAKATKTVAKSVANTAKAAVKSTVNAVKATANLTKAGIQAATGQGAKAKETLKKAGQQAKSAAIDPIKQAAKDTKAVVKDAVIEPTKTFVIDPLKQTIKIAGKVFKVLFIKINPITVLIRSSLRAAAALNLFGVATKMGVGLMTQSNAEKAGYTAEQWETSKKAVDKFKKLFKKMGGDPAKLEKSIKNGANKKPLFKKDIRPKEKINFANGDDGETTIAEPATVAAIVAACGTILATVLSWVSSVVIQNKQTKENDKQREHEEAMQQKQLEEAEKQKAYAAAESDKNRLMQVANAAADAEKTEKRNKTLLIFAGIAAAGILGYAMLGKKGKGKKRR